MNAGLYNINAPMEAAIEEIISATPTIFKRDAILDRMIQDLASASKPLVPEGY
ncbi:hypothetical protein RBB75_09555 [Tunturibacter empetritectus]|uniref:Uncharacterized protein n=1 Tax=Tunturiibacter empetritectus TaxID=3069691 RepID=A0AAU7ZIL2_9BACT